MLDVERRQDALLALALLKQLAGAVPAADVLAGALASGEESSLRCPQVRRERRQTGIPRSANNLSIRASTRDLSARRAKRTASRAAAGPDAREEHRDIPKPHVFV